MQDMFLHHLLDSQMIKAWKYLHAKPIGKVKYLDGDGWMMLVTGGDRQFQSPSLADDGQARCNL